jgi:hypothetical protein
MAIRARNSTLPYNALVERNVTGTFNNGCCSEPQYQLTESYNLFGTKPFTFTPSPTDVINPSPAFINTAADDYRLASNPNSLGVNWVPADYVYGPVGIGAVTPPPTTTPSPTTPPPPTTTPPTTPPPTTPPPTTTEGSNLATGETLSMYPAVRAPGYTVACIKGTRTDGKTLYYVSLQGKPCPGGGTYQYEISSTQSNTTYNVACKFTADNRLGYVYNVTPQCPVGSTRVTSTTTPPTT